jgi:hypothetical protein
VRLAGYVFIVLVLLVGAWLTIHNGTVPPDDQPTIIRAVDARADVERIPPTTTTTTSAPAPKLQVVARARTAPSRPAARRSSASGRCGGDLPPCSVMMRESGGDIHAYNPTGCGGRGCRGKWQCDPRTCTGTGTEAEQDAEARALWADGAGCEHWAAC